MQWQEEMYDTVVMILKSLGPSRSARRQIDMTRNKGIRFDGSPFLNSRFMLYTDGVNEHKSIMEMLPVLVRYIMPLRIEGSYS